MSSEGEKLTQQKHVQALTTRSRVKVIWSGDGIGRIYKVMGHRGGVTPFVVEDEQSGALDDIGDWPKTQVWKLPPLEKRSSKSSSRRGYLKTDVNAHGGDEILLKAPYNPDEQEELKNLTKLSGQEAAEEYLRRKRREGLPQSYAIKKGEEIEVVEILPDIQGTGVTWVTIKNFSGLRGRTTLDNIAELEPD